MRRLWWCHRPCHPVHFLSPQDPPCLFLRTSNEKFSCKSYGGHEELKSMLIKTAHEINHVRASQQSVPCNACTETCWASMLRGVSRVWPYVKLYTDFILKGQEGDIYACGQCTKLPSCAQVWTSHQRILHWLAWGTRAGQSLAWLLPGYMAKDTSYRVHACWLVLPAEVLPVADRRRSAVSVLDFEIHLGSGMRHAEINEFLKTFQQYSGVLAQEFRSHNRDQAWGEQHLKSPEQSKVSDIRLEAQLQVIRHPWNAGRCLRPI